ncbi:DUF202 domain-containing protein [Sphaerisporangium sp. NBC_01403]|uniref:DUF202 domain-containing protein n=1 Tax=Sphaerisporangium TaxID=321315 RepID=UPI0032492D59
MTRPARPAERAGRDGLHMERTALAWTRTATALGAGGLIAAGIAGRHSGDGVAVASFALAALCGAILLARSGVRHRRVQRAIAGSRPLDAEADAMLAWVGVVAAASGALVFVLTLR